MDERHVLAATGVDNTNAVDNNIIFTIKYTKLYVPVVTSSAKDNQKLLKLLSRSVHWNDHKTKSENKNTTNEYRCFLDSNSVGVNRLFVLAYLNRNNDIKRYKALRYYLPKGIINNYSVIINTKTF